ncbi:MAG: hydrogenase nickel incorporation protein HypB [Synergistales bacterium]
MATKRVSVFKSVLAADEQFALRIRREMDERGVLVLNLIGSPGAGKTSLLEGSLRRCRFRAAVVEGDIATARDAERIASCGVPVVQINTKGGCHLEANLVSKALGAFELDKIDVIFIENVGNLVCPAEFDLGEDCKVAVCSTAEGADKPLKYPHLFHECKAVVLTKKDLSPYVRFDRELFWGDVEALNGKVVKIEVDNLTGEGIDTWLEWVEECLEQKRRP